MKSNAQFLPLSQFFQFVSIINCSFIHINVTFWLLNDFKFFCCIFDQSKEINHTFTLSLIWQTCSRWVCLHLGKHENFINENMIFLISGKRSAKGEVAYYFHFEIYMYIVMTLLTLSHIQQICSRRLLNWKIWKISIIVGIITLNMMRKIFMLDDCHNYSRSWAESCVCNGQANDIGPLSH